MSESLVIRHCSPTLAGMKTGSLFSCDCASKEELSESIRRLNCKLGKKGLRVIPVRVSDSRALIYVYRPRRLESDLSNPPVQELLSQRGYPCGQPNRCVVRLIEKLKAEPEFPHEIGLFLGYPIEDVQGFIENKSPCKYSGCWKVYGDEQSAKALFAKYHKCKEVYSARFHSGTSIEKLTVAGR